MFWKVRVIIKAGDLQSFYNKLACFASFFTGNALALKVHNLNRGDAFYYLSCSVQWTKIDWLPEGKIVRVEHTEPSIRKNTIAEYLQ